MGKIPNTMKTNSIPLLLTSIAAFAMPKTGYSPLTNPVQSDWGGLLLYHMSGRFELDSGTRDNLRDAQLELPPGGQPRLFN